MDLDFGKLNTDGGAGKIIEPRKIFTTLARDPRFRRPSDEQGEVLDGWFQNRNRKDNTIKMNTGSGKTLVGLLALQSSINEGVTPAVYVSAENHLVKQVIDEATDLGIGATDDPDDPNYLSGRAILSVNIWKLFNGRSVFGVGSAGVKIPIGAVVIDDTHACLATVGDQFSLSLPAEHPVYIELLQSFRVDLEQQSMAGVLDLEAGDPYALMLAPFWAWKNRQSAVTRIIHAHRGDDAIKFNWPLIRDVLPLCQCVFSGREVEIAPRCLPIEMIPAFARAQRRLFMTATLADDGVLVTHFQANPVAIKDPIKPKGAGVIGDRMILAPQEINPDITVDDVKALASEIAAARNVAVIVPSGMRAQYWSDVAAQILDKDTIKDGVDRLKAGHVGLSVLINKYDGVDLPGDACRLLIIDGLPEVYGLIERVEMAALEGTEMQLLRQVQRIEQGMGRGVRSGEDYCAVLLLGSRLTHRIHMPSARSKFTPATLAQIELGKSVTEQVRGKPLSEIRPVLNYCLDQNPNWVRASRSAVANAPEGARSFVSHEVSHVREAFDKARDGQFKEACDALQAAVNAEKADTTRGYLMLQLAEYEHHQNPAGAQEILLKASRLNRQLIKPIQGVAYSKLNSPAQSQADCAVTFMRRFLEPNELLLFVDALIEDLSWGEEGTKRFEGAIRDLGLFLGFGSQRPESEVGKGPDNLWAIGELRYLVIECKSGCKGDVIGKGDCNQLNGSMIWFQGAYDTTCKPTPIMIHPSSRFDRYSSPLAAIRIMSVKGLDELKKRIRAYAVAVASTNALDKPVAVAAQLTQFGLTANKFVEAFTTTFTVEKN